MIGYHGDVCTSECYLSLYSHLHIPHNTHSHTLTDALLSALYSGPLHGIMRGLIENIMKAPAGMQRVRAYLYGALLYYLLLTKQEKGKDRSKGVWTLFCVCVLLSLSCEHLHLSSLLSLSLPLTAFHLLPLSHSHSISLFLDFPLSSLLFLLHSSSASILRSLSALFSGYLASQLPVTSM